MVRGSVQPLKNSWLEAWNWVQEQGYEVDLEKPCYEIYYNDASQDPEHKWMVDLCIRIKPE